LVWPVLALLLCLVSAIPLIFLGTHRLGPSKPTPAASGGNVVTKMFFAFAGMILEQAPDSAPAYDREDAWTKTLLAFAHITVEKHPDSAPAYDDLGGMQNEAGDYRSGSTGNASSSLPMTPPCTRTWPNICTSQDAWGRRWMPLRRRPDWPHKTSTFAPSGMSSNRS